MYDLRKMFRFSYIHEKKRKTKSSDLSTILKKLREKKPNKLNFFKKPKNNGSNQLNRIKYTKERKNKRERKVLIKDKGNLFHSALYCDLNLLEVRAKRAANPN